MVKYGKQYRLLQLEEWKKYYLDYKGLKHKIKEMKRVLVKELKINKNVNRPSLLTTPLLPDESNDNESIAVLYTERNGEYLKEFVELLKKEFKKSYDFFIDIEKNIVKKINNHLITQTSYSNYSLAELSKEMNSLSLTIYLAKSLNSFINDIMTAIKKILKKFDKNFSHLYGLITPHLILQLFSKKNSEFDYMLEFKIIDEVSVIAESSAKELKKYFDQNNDNSGNKNSDKNEYINTFLDKYNLTLKYIKDIDELINFKTQYKDWVDYVVGKKDSKKSTKFLENDIFNPILSASYHKDNLLDKFLSTKEAFNEIKSIQKPISLMNKRNIILILTQVFFYNTLLTCIFPSLYFYEYMCAIEKDNTIDNFWFLNISIFLIVGSTYFAQFLSIFIFYNYVPIKYIKISYIISYSFIIIGSLIYILSIFQNFRGEEESKDASDVGHYKIRSLILGISRFLIGLGSNPMQGKKYITLYTPKYYLPIISKIYLIIELSGFIIGPSITALFSFLRIGRKIYCMFNCLGYYGFIGSLILLIINFFLFTSPKNTNFFIVKNQTKDDVNISNSQVAKNNFEDDEDTQDKEFYKLQKEANERKSQGLDPTKSDEVHIEIKDNEPTKSGLIKTTSSNFEEKEKEGEGVDYNKIIENEGEGLEHNEIAEKFLSNVDTGRYSDVDMSDEQKDDDKEKKEKLNIYQENSNFKYINMIPRTLDDIILKEQKTFGYMNKNFIIILLLLLFNNFIKENLIIYSAYYILFIIYDNGEVINIPKDEDVLYYSQKKNTIIQIICLLISCEYLLQILSIVFIMPFYKVNLIFKKNLIIFMIMSIVLMIPLSIPYLDKIYIYVPIVSLDIVIHKIIETRTCCYLVYLIPPQWKYAHIRASSLPIYFMTFAKLCACALCFLCFNGPTDVDKDSLKKIFKLDQHILIAIAFFIYGIIGFIIYKSDNFRVKALARILRKRAME